MCHVKCAKVSRRGCSGGSPRCAGEPADFPSAALLRKMHATHRPPAAGRRPASARPRSYSVISVHLLKIVKHLTVRFPCYNLILEDF